MQKLTRADLLSLEHFQPICILATDVVTDDNGTANCVNTRGFIQFDRTGGDEQCSGKVIRIVAAEAERAVTGLEQCAGRASAGAAGVHVRTDDLERRTRFDIECQDAVAGGDARIDDPELELAVKQAEAAAEVSAQGEDGLLMGEFGNTDDAELRW